MSESQLPGRQAKYKRDISGTCHNNNYSIARHFGEVEFGDLVNFSKDVK